MSTIALKCPKGHTRTVDLQFAGKSAVCNECGHVWKIPAAPRKIASAPKRPPASAPSPTGELACPACAETIKAAAKKCRFCGHAIGAAPSAEADKNASLAIRFVQVSIAVACIPLPIMKMMAVSNATGMESFNTLMRVYSAYEIVLLPLASLLEALGLVFAIIAMARVAPRGVRALYWVIGWPCAFGILILVLQQLNS